jgi:hypothetical protein
MKETTLIVLLLMIILIGGYFIINDSQQEDEQEKTIVINNTKYVPYRQNRILYPGRRLRRNYFYDRLYNDHIYYDDDDYDDYPSYIYGRFPGWRRKRYRDKSDRLDDSQTSDPVKPDKPVDKSSGNKVEEKKFKRQN